MVPYFWTSDGEDAFPELGSCSHDNSWVGCGRTQLSATRISTVKFYQQFFYVIRICIFILLFLYCYCRPLLLLLHTHMQQSISMWHRNMPMQGECPGVADLGGETSGVNISKGLKCPYTYLVAVVFSRSVDSGTALLKSSQVKLDFLLSWTQSSSFAIDYS